MIRSLKHSSIQYIPTLMYFIIQSSNQSLSLQSLTVTHSFLYSVAVPFFIYYLVLEHIVLTLYVVHDLVLL